MNLNQIKKTRVYEQVIEQIKLSIEAGEISPGDKLPSERELAVKLSISRSVVREAMSVLSAQGLLDIRPGIGVFLADDEEQQLIQGMNRILNKEQVDVSELLEVRQGLECQAAYLAAQRATDKDLQGIRDALLKLEKAVNENQVAAKEDFAFHAAIVRASKNILIIEMLALLSDRFIAALSKSRSQSLLKPNKAKQVVIEHYEIYEAIQSRDPERAHEMMLKHLESVKQSYEKQREDGKPELIQS